MKCTPGGAVENTHKHTLFLYADALETLRTHVQIAIPLLLLFETVDSRLKPGARKAAGGVIGGAGIASQHGTTDCWSRYSSR